VVALQRHHRRGDQRRHLLLRQQCNRRPDHHGQRPDSLDVPDTGIVNATTNIIVTGSVATALAITSPPQTVVAGSLSASVVVEELQSDGQPAVSGTAMDIDLSSTSPVGTFRATAQAAAPAVSHLSIPPGASEISAYYSSDKSGPSR